MSTKKKAKNKIEVRTEFTQIKHEFDRVEIDQLVKDLTEGISNVNELEEQKKATGAEYSSKIKTQKARNQETVNRLNAGYHMVEAQCEVEMDYSSRMKRFFPIRDTGKRGAMAKQEPMSEIDLQSQLPLKDPRKPAKGDKPADAAPDGEKPAKKPRNKKVAPGQPLVSVAEAMPASHEMTPVRGELIGDENDESPD